MRLEKLLTCVTLEPDVFRLDLILGRTGITGNKVRSENSGLVYDRETDYFMKLTGKQNQNEF